MEESILTSTKKVLGLAAEYTAFDYDVIMFINNALSTAEQFGIGLGVVFIEDNTTTWSQLNIETQNLVMLKHYVYLKARLAFDPPPTSFAIEAMEKQIQELEWRMRTRKEFLDQVP